MTQPRYAETINLNHFDTTRIYRINQRQYPSVTSIIGMMDKPALVPWAAKMAAEYAANHLELLNQLDIEDRILLIKNNWRKQLTRAADFGTAVHKMIEEGTYPDPTERAFSYCLAAERMLTDWELTVDTQEITLVNPAAGYAGTVDVTAYNPTAELFYLDWKTGKGSYIDSHGMQLSALMEATHYIDQEGTLHPAASCQRPPLSCLPWRPDQDSREVRTLLVLALRDARRLQLAEAPQIAALVRQLGGDPDAPPFV